MSLLCFSMGFALTKEEEAQLSHITIAAYNAWVLVNDYFSWEKEVLNYEANGSEGEIVSAVFLFMRWYSVDAQKAKSLLREEIIFRENTYCELKEQYLRQKNVTERAKYWFTLLDLVTAGNFAWSSTTARYLKGQDAYPALRTKHKETQSDSARDNLDEPISQPPKINGHTNGHHRKDSKLTNGVHTNGVEPFLAIPGVLLQPFEAVSNGTCLWRSNLTVQTVLEPGKYVQSMPSKGIRNSAIDALDVWYEVPDASLHTIRDIVNTLHNSSLMYVDQL